MSKVVAPVRFAGTTLRDRAHICAFFNDPEEAYRVLLPFVQEGLELGEKAFHTVDPRRREEHIRWLANAGIDVAAGHSNGQVEIIDWTAAIYETADSTRSGLWLSGAKSQRTLDGKVFPSFVLSARWNGSWRSSWT